MTILSAFTQNLNKHSELTNWWIIRQAMDLVERVPVPKSFVIRRVAFRVQKQRLPGVLKELDAAEDGTRVLNGEWIVDRHIWESRRMGYIDSKHKGAGEKVMLYLHGGAYYICSAETHRLITVNLSKACGLRVFALNYRLAPETPFPGALQDAVLAYLHLVKELQVPPSHIIIAGDSAGGGLTLATLLYLRDNNFPLPCGAILMSPWVDLTLSTRSWETNAQHDVLSLPEPGDHLDPVRCYLGEQGLKSGLATHPYVSPLFAKYDVNEKEGRTRLLPPLLIQCGGAEVLRDECTLLAHKAAKGGVPVMFEYYEDAVHVFQTFTWLQPAGKAYERCGVFVKHTIPAYEATQEALTTSARHGVPATIKEEDEVTPRARDSTIEEAAEDAIETRVDEEIGGGDSREMFVVDSMGEVEDEVLVGDKGGSTTQGNENGEEELGEKKALAITIEPPKDEATDAYQQEEKRSNVKTEYTSPQAISSTPLSIPRSQSATSLPASGVDGPRTPLYGNLALPSSQRRHSRRWTGLGALHSFTPLHVGGKGEKGGWSLGEPSNTETDDGADWTFTPGSHPTSARGSVSLAPSGSVSPASIGSIPRLKEGTTGYFTFPSTTAASQANLSCGPAIPLITPGLRQGRRSRSSTLSSNNGAAGEEVENLVRQWEKEGPANESVFCRKL
ncbi:hypothetical protein FS837_009828 [Tulasnella sp. UAMH 9824]|nr:hypothetical protein FS837_009828 [Tulasnella sp. UAMH 9824]